jgi:hypothetical protein
MFLVVLINKKELYAKELPGREEFNKCKNELVSTVNKMATYGAEEAYHEIKKNLAEFKQLHDKVKSANGEEVFDFRGTYGRGNSGGSES